MLERLSFTCRRHAQFCLSCDCSVVDPPPVTLGRTMSVGSGPSPKQRVGSKGDPLMPCFSTIAIHVGLEEVAAHLEDGEKLCAFLDDVYVLCQPHRVVTLFKLFRESLDRVAGIRLLEGKRRVWNRSGTASEDIEELGEEVWQPEGLKVLATPVGSPQFIDEKLRERVGEERRLWDATPRRQGPPVRMTIVGAKRQSPGQPHVAHTSTKPLQPVRTRPR